MSYLEQATRAVPTAPIITIIGFPGSGKTTLAGLFNKPIFIQAEKSSTVFENTPIEQQPVFMPMIPSPDKARAVSSRAIVREQLLELATVEHDFKTVIIDSITSLNDLYEKEVVAFDAAGADSNGNAAGGYHKGYDVVAGYHADLIRMSAHLTKKGIAVVFIAHVGVAKIKSSPDEAAEYTVWSVGMHEKSRSLYIKHSDAVLYLKSRQFVSGQESDKKGKTIKAGRAFVSGERYLIASSEGTTGFVDAKNRYDMPQELYVPQGENPIMQYIPFFNQQ